MISQPARMPLFSQPPPSHLDIDNEKCPWCEQEIPPEKLEEINGKIVAKERRQAEAIKAQAEAKAKADLELEHQRSAVREIAAREEARKTAEAAAAEKLAEVERRRQEMQAGLQLQLAQEGRARIAAEQASASLQTEFQRFRHDTEAALAAVKSEAKAREREIHAEARQTAEAAVAEKLAASETARVKSEAALQARIAKVEETKAAAEQKGFALQAQLDELCRTKDDQIAEMKEAAAAVHLRQEAIEAAQASVRDTMFEKDKVIAEAKAKRAEAEDKVAKQLEQHELVLKQQLDSQRETLEKANDDAINAERAKAFEEKQKLLNKVAEMQRAIEKKTADELGEGAEIDLFEALKKEFPSDGIDRINKGSPGADIRQVVRHNGRECGIIIHDSKNHKVFRNDHVTKLLQDKIAALAEHAILSTHQFPQGTRQLHIQDGVVLANPARVITVVTLIRQHMLQAHILRLSNTEREHKTAALYDFIVSDQCAQFFARIDANAEDLLELQVKEKKFHDTTWKKEGLLIKQIQKTQADLLNEISCITGTAPDDPSQLEEIEFEELE
jgi:hypothetical protein